MPKQKIIPIGTKVGNWTILSEDRIEISARGKKLFARCKCGHEKWVVKHDLTRTRTRNLRGCQKCSAGVIHGRSKSSLFQRCNNMKQRCENPNNNMYRFYGGRKENPIKFKFKSVLEAVLWIERNLGECPSASHSIDRINNDGHYEPGNLRWATQSVQSSNKRPYGKTGEKYICIEKFRRIPFKFKKGNCNKRFRTLEDAVKFRNKFLSEGDSFKNPRN